MEDLEIKIPKGAVQGVVNAHIRSAVAEALGKDPTKLIGEVVRQAMRVKASRYGNETLFEEAVNKQIREVADECFREWLEEQRPMIRKRLRDELKKVAMADKLLDALKDSLYVSVQIKRGE